MIKISLTEKLWDSVRPSSVTKTGLSEAIRDFAKQAAKPLDKPKDFDDLDAAIGELAKAIGVAEAAMKKAKDDKKGAADKLEDWKAECTKARADLASQRRQTGLLKAVSATDTRMKEMAQEVEQAIVKANRLLNDVESGRNTNLKASAVEIQTIRDASRNALKATQKDGFAEYFATFDAITVWGLKSSDVPLPPSVKTIKPRIAVLLDAAEKARVAVEGLAGRGAGDGDAVAEAARAMQPSYDDIKRKLKAQLPEVKKLNTQAHESADKFKVLIAKGAPHQKLLPILEKLHTQVLEADEAALKEIARNRIKSGDVAMKFAALNKELNPQQQTELSQRVGPEWSLVMVMYRELSEQTADAQRQVQRVARLVAESSPEAREVALPLAELMDREAKQLRNKYL